MKMKTIFLKFIALTSILFCTYSCDTKSRLNCVCLIDYSGSLTEETLKSYSEIITNTIFKNLNDVDRLIVIPIDEGAKTQAIKIAYEDLSAIDFSKATDGFTHKQDSIKKRISTHVETKLVALYDEIINQKKLRKQFTDKTDIISAMEQVQLLLENPKEDNFLTTLSNFVFGKPKLIPENVIIIFSDMIQESTDFNFAQLPDDATRFDEVLENLIQNKRIPDLKLCSIFVDGRTGKSNSQVENIKNFWIAYFKNSGGNLISYDFDCRKDIESFMQKRRELNK